MPPYRNILYIYFCDNKVSDFLLYFLLPSAGFSSSLGLPNAAASRTSQFFSVYTHSLGKLIQTLSFKYHVKLVILKCSLLTLDLTVELCTFIFNGFHDIYLDVLISISNQHIKSCYLPSIFTKVTSL